ncbi:hypothetical protein HANVADRAFT_35412 [Hanseniaspora valbyensis NRRL Y-1626]|uniref:37S ribosomal protein S35, mitochondrial n=1 Tax=Hanseniaspora valbyensis NRRL Y-1626 TaxID=766949 RepID=A0A1B7T848_9ASCO|nr:hypothetical protein HANVADRAFT_35412 [Hanseniaspora valbyensis NRRL Y-1626]
MLSSQSNNVSATVKSFAVAQLTTKRFARNAAKNVKRPRFHYNLPEKDAHDVVTNKTLRTSQLEYALRQFTGPKDYRGDFIYNKYYFPAVDHIPKYLHCSLEDGKPLRLKQTGEILEFPKPETNLVKPGYVQKAGRMTLDSVVTSVPRYIQPFPLNPYCKTNSLVSNELKKVIRTAVNEKKLPLLTVSSKLSLKVNRVEAINKLMGIEEDLREKKILDEDMDIFGETMYGMFPLYDPIHEVKGANGKRISLNGSDDLEELPGIKETESSKFMTVNEGDEFTNLDAANVLFLEPADKVIELLKLKSQQTQADKLAKLKERNIILGKKYKTDRFDMQFVDVNVGETGKRYGTGNRDNKKNRKVIYDINGKKVYK